MEMFEYTKEQPLISESIEKYKAKEKEISALLLATETILKSEDFNKTAKQVFDSCAKLIGAKAGYVALLSDDGAENELLFLEDGGMTCTVNPELPMPIRGLRETAYRTGKVVFDNNFMKSEWVNFMPKGHMALKNVLFSPLNIDNKTVGIMGFACKDGDFTENDAKIAAAFGNYAAIALRNSRTLEELTASNKSKDKLFSIIAHDLRSPFNTLIGYSDLLIEKTSQSTDEELHQYSTIINKSLYKAFNYLTNLLEWSRLQTNRIEFAPSSFALHELVSEVKEILLAQAQNKKVVLNITIREEIELFADRNMIKIVLVNLISNAIKYSYENSNILISSIRSNNQDKIFIEDNGVGIIKNNCEKLFKVDESYSTLGTNNEKGTGLGLVLCSDFVKRHNGQITVESEIGKGSIFCISLPVLKKNRD